MFSIIEHIEYLTTRHDCVTVPGLGAFIANYDNACFEEEAVVFARPHRTINFNANIIHNDGLLVQSVMRREHLEYDDAMKFITDSVASFRKQLMDCEVPMGHLGHFKCNSDQRIEFVPLAHAVATDSFYGLADLEIKPIDTLEAESDREHKAIKPDFVTSKNNGIFSRKAIQIAASVVVLIGLGIMLSTPIIVDRNHQNMASIVPEVSAPQPQQLGTTAQQGVVAQPIEKIEDNSPLAKVGNTTGKYYMVIATLRNQHEIDAFKSKYSSLVPYMKMLDYKGMSCVYVARSDNYDTLMSLRSELPERLRDVWIYN